ncbi:hypothetical protein RFI_01486 [Reticulomyxa filosa]|uniref:Uncharacterized protein n=1 Tax=Reticulomyxa filosa TaxID=46433 RepID=X6PD21_RETFI|nr:hypothetical protein RFI_01486 [Reticulomyxa filosa]|eukprot:ETO35577.1 hypothetical protein RFI_01486 [Reticulomyxa filosa]
MKWLHVQYKNIQTWLRDGLIIARIWLNSDSNVLGSSDDAGVDRLKNVTIVNHSFEDTALRAILKQSRAKFEHIARTCVAGAILRYCSDETHSSIDSNNTAFLTKLSKARVLEDYDMSQNETLQGSEALSSSPRSRSNVGFWKGTRWMEALPSPLFNEKIGLTSIPLAIGEQFSHARQRLMHIAKPSDVLSVSFTVDFFFLVKTNVIINIHRYEEYRWCWWINKILEISANILPDRMCKAVMARFFQHHTMELCYFPCSQNLVFGRESVENIRVLKTNINAPCLCISTYNDRMYLDLTYCGNAINEPDRFIQGFLAEMEDLEAIVAFKNKKQLCSHTKKIQSDWPCILHYFQKNFLQSVKEVERKVYKKNQVFVELFTNGEFWNKQYFEVESKIFTQSCLPLFCPWEKQKKK